jgi:hypothetical protein
MDGCAGHGFVPSMIIDDLNVHGARRSLRPPETNPPFIINPNRELSGAIALECFQSVARQCGQIGKASSGI